jgi:hypothetical protein
VKGQPQRFVNGHNKRLAIKVDPNATEKTCTGCGELKPIEEFHRKSNVPHGRKARCRDCEAKSQSQIDRSKYRHHQVAWHRRNPEKKRAHGKVQKAIEAGVLVRPDQCSRCGNDGRIQAHHRDYSKPLEVVWLCQRCHKQEHAR